MPPIFKNIYCKVWVILAEITKYSVTAWKPSCQGYRIISLKDFPAVITLNTGVLLRAGGSGIALTGHTNHYNGFLQYHMPSQKNSSCCTEITCVITALLEIWAHSCVAILFMWTDPKPGCLYLTAGCFVRETEFLHCLHSPIQMDFCQYKVMHDLSLLLHPTPDADRSPYWGEKWAWICFWYTCKWGWSRQEESGKIYTK